MARLYLSPGDTVDPIGSIGVNIIGTNDAETVIIGADSKNTFDGSFSRGNDTIIINGNAGLYTASIFGSSLRLTSTNGANILIPLGEGVTIDFADADPRELSVDGQTVTLGGQVIPSTGTIGVTPGDDTSEPGDTIDLEIGADDLVGTAGDDVFSAKVVQSGTGEQTNQLGTGDQMDGGAGFDTLAARLQDASALNGNPNAEVAPITFDVERIQIQADQARSSEDVDAVEVDAEEMYGVEQLVSYYSDADLVFYNVNTLGDDGLDDDQFGEDNGRATASIEICMDHTAGSNVLFGASDLSVYFDADYLIPGAPESGETEVVLQLLDIDNQINEQRPLETNPFDILYITFADGSRQAVRYDGNNDLSGFASYQALATSINAGLATAGLTTFTATVGELFTVTDTDNDPGGPASGYNIVITDTSGSSITQLDFGASDVVPGDTDYHKQVFAVEEPDELQLIASDICLIKAGQGGDGGALTVGSMNTYGVEQFNVMLMGADNQDSSISYLQSTNNVLREVYVDSPDGDSADLTIGNSQTFGGEPNGAYSIDSDLTDSRNNALRDVQIFDASALGAGSDVALYANLSDAFTPKYLDLMDTDANAQADNIAAQYLFGGGNDLLNINISQENFAYEGAATREDFAFLANTGAGDDTVYVQIGDGYAVELGEFEPDLGFLSSNWYTNHLLNENLTILTEGGNDFIWAFGSSAADLIAGAGDDVVYSDNSGVLEGVFNDGRATWVFNSQNTDVDDLLSFGATSIANAANLTLTVQYMDFTVTVDLGNSANSINGVSITDLTVNQAIKDAINNHPVLGDFLVASDGPGRTLIVESLVDGETAETDLTVSIGDSGGARSPAQLAGSAVFFEEFTADQLAALGFNPDGTALTDTDPVGGFDENRWDAQFGTDGLTLDGVNSITINNNRVEGGAGNDEIALSTDLTSIETLVISDEQFGVDHVLNFNAAVADGPIAATTEVQTITFTGDFSDPDDDGTVIVNVADEQYEIPVDSDPASPTPTTAEQIAAAVATAINTDTGTTGISATSTPAGVVTITYPVGVPYPQATAVIVGPPSEVQVVDIDGPQEGDATITVTINGTAYAVDIEDGDTPEEIVDAIEAEVGDSDPLVEFTDNLDGSFTLEYYTSYNPPLASISNLNTTDVTVTETSPFDPTAVFAPGTEVAEATISEGAPALDTELGYDIFDLSDIIGEGGPEYFENDLQADGNEFAEINALVDSSANGVLLIDTVEADDYAFAPGTSGEEARLQQMITAADNTAQTGTDTSVIITVSDNLIGNFYKVTDGAAAGDASVDYLGSVYLGGSDAVGKEFYGDWDALTEANFTPLSPTELMETYSGGVIA